MNLHGHLNSFTCQKHFFATCFSGSEINSRWPLGLFFLIENICSYSVFWSRFSLPQLLSDSSYPPNSKQTGKQTNKNPRTHQKRKRTQENTRTHPTKSEAIIYMQKTIRQKCPNSIRQKVYKVTIEFVLCWQSTAGHGVVNILSETSLEKTNFSFESVSWR